MRFITTFALGFCAVGLPIAAAALEAIVPYDGFAGAELDATRWTTLESVREIINGKVHLRYRIASDSTSNSGIASSNLGLSFPAPQKVRDIGATVRVTSYVIDKCQANTGSGWTGVRLAGSFFNASKATPGDETNDVIAQARVWRSVDSTAPKKALAVDGIVVQCTNSDCSTSKTLGDADLGSLAVGASTKLLMRWDPAHNRFLFRRDSGAYKAVAYKVSDTKAPGAPFKAVQVRNRAENCTAQPTEGMTDALIDSVTVNASAAP